MAQTIAQERTPQATFIEGAAGTGKTHELVARASELLHQGTPAEDMLVLCATPQAAHEFQRRVRIAYGDQAAPLHVTTARAYALSVLSRPDAIAWTGRKPRMLAAFEEKFLMEDMKVCGVRPKRLREMLKFFYRSWTELADERPDWLLPGEETDVHTLLKRNLNLLQSVLEPEAANLAVRFLKAHDRAQEECQHAWVLVDDWQCQSRASQQLAELVARDGIIAAADRVACVEVYDSYPYEQGIEEFLSAHPGADHRILTTCRRSGASQRAMRALLSDEGLAHAEPARPEVQPAPECTDAPAHVLAAHCPADEFQTVARTVKHLIAEGNEPRTMAVAVPNSTWAHNMHHALRTEGVAAHVLAGTQPVRGDVRKRERSTEAQMLTALELVADATNALAWRCWCGYGDYLVNSAAIAALRAHAEETGKGLVAELEQLAAHPAGSEQAACSTTAPRAEDAVGASRVAQAYQCGQQLIARCQGLSGRALLDAIAHEVDGSDAAPALITQLCLMPEQSDEATPGVQTPCNSAAAMANRFRTALLAPTLPADNAVTVVPYHLLCGLSPKTLVISGFVNGFIPTRDYFDTTVTTLDKQVKIHAEDARRVYALASKADDQLIVSYFTSTDLESAGILKLKIDRIRLEHAVRTCAISPSDFLKQVAPGN